MSKNENYQFGLTDSLINTICSHEYLDDCFNLVLRLIDSWDIRKAGAGAERAKVY